MYRISQKTHDGEVFLGADETTWGRSEDAADFESFNEAEDVRKVVGGTIQHRNLPCFILSGLDADDVLTTICHWHYDPDQEDVEDMIATTKGGYLFFCISEVKRIPVPCRLPS